MKIFVRAKAGAKEDKVTPPQLKLEFVSPAPSQGSDGASYTVSVKELPKEGRANEAVARLLAKHFNVPRPQVRLVSGATSKRKVFEIKN